MCRGGGWQCPPHRRKAGSSLGLPGSRFFSPGCPSSYTAVTPGPLLQAAPGSSRRLTAQDCPAFLSLMSPPRAQPGLGPGWQDKVRGVATGSISPGLPRPP